MSARQALLSLLARYGKRRYLRVVCRGSILGRHKWQPAFISLGDGLMARPGECHVVCLRCREHTYANTCWAGYYLGVPLRDRQPA